MRARNFKIKSCELNFLFFSNESGGIFVVCVKQCDAVGCSFTGALVDFIFFLLSLSCWFVDATGLLLTWGFSYLTLVKQTRAGLPTLVLCVGV